VEVTTEPTLKRGIKRPFYQFGLSLEDESIQAVERAWQEGHRYAAVIASSAEWSSRAAKVFVEHWRSRGGTVVADRRYDEGSNYSDIIKSLLNIDQSEQRARKLRSLLGRPFEFEPRRRQDIDMIFLVARSSEGQQIKPTLAFYYAGDIPVYATSQIYSSAEDASKNRDLDGIRFTTLPWILESDNPSKQLIHQYINVSPSYERLYALGVDAFLLHDRLQQLTQSKDSFIYGKTGKLKSDQQQRIVREQPWAEIIQGVAQPLPQLIQQKDESSRSDE
jgi:outer membrane PBP1 activator LpoA protein